MARGDLGNLRFSEGERQAAVARSGGLQMRGDRNLQRITDFAASKYNTMFGSIAFISGKREILVARCGIPFWEAPRSESFCAVAIHHPGEPLVVPDATQDPRFANFPTVCASPFIRFYAGMPLVDRAGYALGALCVADPEPRTGQIDVIPLMLLAREAEREIAR